MKSIARTGLSWAFVLGLIGFLGGFVGPMVFMPDSNQGPLIGLFITGPGGVVLGFVAGVIHALIKRDRDR